MQDSIFTKIIKGEIPCHKVYEDDKALAFMDIYPIQPGQVVVVPKKQVGFVWDLEDEDYVALMMAVKKVGQRLREIFPDKDRVGVMVEGLDVTDHAHVKVFPFSAGGEFRALPTKNEPNHEELAHIAEKLRFS
jgi:histidine triad (HIT) family protein